MPTYIFRKGLALCASLIVLSACSDTTPSPQTETSRSEQPEADSKTRDALTRIQHAVKLAKSTQGTGSPALWTLADEDTTIYLFGTVHLLPESLNWRTDSFTQAFTAADTLYLEIDSGDLEDQQAMQTLIVEHGLFKDGKTLSSVLDSDDLATVAAAAETVGVPMASIDPVMPWFAGLQLSLVQLMKSGYSPDSGVEQVLVLEAKASGKSFGNFETASEQIQILSGAPLEDQIESLVFTAKTIDTGKDMLDTIVDEWADGDIAGMSALMGEPAMFGSQDAYDALMVNRNRNWVPQIESILDDPGVKFVAVGAGHLSGPDSVIAMLREKGYDITAAQ